MRENLFERRLNLAVYEKGVTEWSMPDIHAEVRKKHREEQKGVNRTWTDREYEEAIKEGRPRPCANGCGFQATSLEKHCCKACIASGKHGAKCDRIPMPGQKMQKYTVTAAAKAKEKKEVEIIKEVDEKQEKVETTQSAPAVSHGSEELVVELKL